MVLPSILGKVSAGQDLTLDEMTRAVEQIMGGQCHEGEIGLLLTALRAKGETFEEIAGAATAMRRAMTPIHSAHTNLLDTCGTGGSGSNVFNVSTAAALVVAAAGQPVAKHGNRGISSKSGSADVLAELGVNIEASVSQVEKCLAELGACFCFAPLFHQSMKHVATVRKKLGVPTIFNVLGPLCNPAGAPFQLVGVGHGELRDTMARALRTLGTTRAVVVHGEDGLDEVSLGGTTHISHVQNGDITELEWCPESFGLPRTKIESLKVSNPQESAAMIRAILAGAKGPPRDVVVINAAAALWTAGVATDLGACAEIAADAIDSNATQKLLDGLIRISAR